MKKFYFYLILISIPLLLFILIFEIFFPKYYKFPCLVYRYWGYRPATFFPNLKLRAVSDNYDNYFSTNSLGFNDIEHLVYKGNNVFRILLLGDSYIEAYGVQPSKHMARIIEQLAQNNNINIEVISLGMSGYGQSHHLLNYEKIGKFFKPHLIIHFFCPNDMWDNRIINIDTKLGTPIYQLIDNNLQIGPKNEKKISKLKIFLQKGYYHTNSYFLIKFIVKIVYQKYFITDEQKIAAQLAGTAKIDNTSKQITLDKEQNLFKALAKKIKSDMVERDKSNVLNVIVSSDVTTAPSKDFLTLLSFVEDTFGDLGIQSINFDKLFRKKFLNTKTIPCFATDSHWNETGHRWVAEELFPIIKNSLNYKEKFK